MSFRIWFEFCLPGFDRICDGKHAGRDESACGYLSCENTALITAIPATRKATI